MLIQFIWIQVNKEQLLLIDLLHLSDLLFNITTTCWTKFEVLDEILLTITSTSNSIIQQFHK